LPYKGDDVQRDRLYLAIYIFVLAPIGAVVAVCAMLLFGVKPHTVFAVGFAIKAMFGPHVPNAVGVAGTVAIWWVAIVIVGLVWERLRRHPQP
jgi:hypothetical protein